MALRVIDDFPALFLFWLLFLNFICSLLSSLSNYFGS